MERAAKGRSAQAQRGRLGTLLARARDGVPQQVWFPRWARSARDAFGAGVAGRNRPAEEGDGGPKGRSREEPSSRNISRYKALRLREMLRREYVNTIP
jgi:hypothetical protein